MENMIPIPKNNISILFDFLLVFFFMSVGDGPRVPAGFPAQKRSKYLQYIAVFCTLVF